MGVMVIVGGLLLAAGGATGPALPSLDLDQVNSWGQFALTVIAVVSAVALIRRRADKRQEERIKKIVRDETASVVAEATKQIQPGANGGEALADVAKLARATHETLLEVRENMADMRDKTAVWRKEVTDEFLAQDERREAIRKDTAAEGERWRVALGEQGITIPPRKD